MATAGAMIGWLVSGGAQPARAESVTFLDAAAIQPYPFTPAADIRGRTSVKGVGPFGGTGSDFVCDRELLIRLLRERPDRLREWARVVGVSPPAPAAVAKYIRSLRPATLIRDTRVTNHSYRDGRAVAFQAILAAGTAVLVDPTGAVRARCRCGNPLLDPVLFSSEQCANCPPHYRPPRSWRLATLYYFPYPDPPPARGEPKKNTRDRKKGEKRTIVVKEVAPKTQTLTTTQMLPGGTATVTVTSKEMPPGRTRTVTRTVRVPTTVRDTTTVREPTTVVVPTTVISTVTVEVTTTVRDPVPNRGIN